MIFFKTTLSPLPPSNFSHLSMAKLFIPWVMIFYFNKEKSWVFYVINLQSDINFSVELRPSLWHTLFSFGLLEGFILWPSSHNMYKITVFLPLSPTSTTKQKWHFHKAIISSLFWTQSLVHSLFTAFKQILIKF